MNARRVVFVGAGAVVLSGCGAGAGLAAKGSHSAPAAALAHAVAPAAPTAATATPAPPPTATPQPTPPPPQAIVVTSDAGSGALAIMLVSSAGSVIGSTTIPADAQWTVGTGIDSAYWVSAGRLQRLDAHGTTTLADVPATQSGRVVVSPDGSQWAYATMSQDARGIVTDRLYRGGPGRRTALVAQRIADPSRPATDAPPAWQYYPVRWTSRGILVERQPVGGCGCGTPFDMEMTAGYSAFIDPITGVATPVTQSATCPMSGVGIDGTAACFDMKSGAAASIVLSDTMHPVARYSLSGTTLGGDATFDDGSLLAYATVSSTAGGCGGPDWRPETSLHVMDTRSGTARIVGRRGLNPSAWLNDGTILATLDVAGPGDTTTSSVVAVDPATGHMRTILDRTADIVGLA